jgi:hypothetical protein
MSSDTGIWLGDAARAFAALHPADIATRDTIASLLGLATRRPSHKSMVRKTPDSDRNRQIKGQSTTEVPTLEARNDAKPSSTANDLPLLTPVRREVADLTGWGPGESLPRVTAEHLGGVPRHESLLAPRSASSIVNTLLARDASDGPVDVAAVVDAVARRRVLRSVPHEPRMTLRFGAQLLLDVGDGMELFIRDEEMLAQQVQRVVGAATHVGYFADCPLRGTGPGSIWTWDRYQPPHPRTSVLVASNFGIGGPLLHPGRSRLKEWMTFARMLADTGCSLVGLVPYPPARWPQDLARRITLVTWDRGTTVGAIIAQVHQQR